MLPCLLLSLWQRLPPLPDMALSATSGRAHSLMPSPLTTSLVSTLVTMVETPPVWLLTLPPSLPRTMRLS